MTQETMPFFDSAEEATTHAIHASGQTFKQVGCAVYPEKTAEAAATALRNALNPNRDERLTFDQHLLIARHCNHYAVLRYACFKTSHSQPVIQTPTEEAARLQQQLFTVADQFKSLLAQVETLKPRLQQAGA